MDGTADKIVLFVGVVIGLGIISLVIGGVYNATDSDVIFPQTTSSIDLTPNIDIVESGNYVDPVNAINGQFAKDNGERDFLFVEHTSRIRTDGTISKIYLKLGDHASHADIDTLVYKVWRYDGATYDLVGESDFTTEAKAAGPGLQTINLPTQISGVQEGDYSGLYMSTSGLNTDAFWNSDAFAVTGTYFYTASEAPDIDADFETQTTNANYVPIDVFMQAPSIVFIGDSITSGASPHDSFINNETDTNISATWAYQTATSLGVTYQNMGKNNGDGSDEVLARLTADVIDLKPKVAVVAVGTHDVNTAVAEATYISNMDSILTTLTSNGITPVVLTIYPRTDFTNIESQNADSFNSALISLVNNDHPTAVIADTRSVIGEFRSGGDAGNLWNIIAAYDSGDGIHPNAAGHIQIANVVIAAFDQLSTNGSSWAQLHQNAETQSQSAFGLLMIVVVIIAAVIILSVIKLF